MSYEIRNPQSAMGSPLCGIRKPHRGSIPNRATDVRPTRSEATEHEDRERSQ
jgi:hypothetical protein